MFLTSRERQNDLAKGASGLCLATWKSGWMPRKLDTMCPEKLILASWRNARLTIGWRFARAALVAQGYIKRDAGDGAHPVLAVMCV